MIIYKAGKIKSLENLKAVVKFIGDTEEFTNFLWKGFMDYEDLYEEFNYYCANNSLMGKASYKHLTLLDLYFSQMNKYNQYHDVGKNPIQCNKQRMVMHSFYQMIAIRNNPTLIDQYDIAEEGSIDLM